MTKREAFIRHGLIAQSVFGVILAMALVGCNSRSEVNINTVRPNEISPTFTETEIQGKLSYRSGTGESVADPRVYDIDEGFNGEARFVARYNDTVGSALKIACKEESSDLNVSIEDATSTLLVRVFPPILNTSRTADVECEVVFTASVRSSLFLRFEVKASPTPNEPPALSMTGFSGGVVVGPGTGASLNNPKTVVVAEGETGSAVLTASDPNGWKFQDGQLSCANLPGFVSSSSDYSAQTVTVTFSPGYINSGVYPFSCSATDGAATTIFYFSLTVSDVNQPPTLKFSSISGDFQVQGTGDGTIPAQAINFKIPEGKSGGIVLVATDDSHNFVSPDFSCVTLPSFLVATYDYINERILLFSNAQTVSQTTEYLFQCNVSDLEFSIAFYGKIIVENLAPPQPFSITAPVANSFTKDKSPLIAWTQSLGADSYTVKISTDALCNGSVVGPYNVPASTTSQEVGDLPQDGVYHACVTAVNGGGTVTRTSLFTVDTTPPPPFSVTGPAATVFVSNPAVTWSQAEAGAKYQLKVSTVAGCLNADIANVSNLTALSYNLSNLGSGTYHVCLSAADAAQNVTAATPASYSFQVVGLPKPFNITAPVGLTVDSTPLVQWESSENATTYRVMIDPVGVSCQGLLISNVVTPVAGSLQSYQAPTLLDGAFRVCVRASNGAGFIEDTSDFSVDTTPPGAFSVTGPGPQSSSTPTITWSQSAGAVSYSLKVDNDSGCPSPIVSEPTLSGSSFVLTTPLGAGIHHVCMSSTDAAGWTTAAPPYSFQVILPPGPFSILSPVSVTKDSTPTISWSPSANAVQYLVQVATDSECATAPAAWQQVVSSVSGSFTFTAPFVDGTYTACVTAQSPPLPNTIKETKAFTIDTVPPGAFSITSIVGTSTPTPLVTWQASNGASKYTVIVDQEPTCAFPQTKVLNNVTNTSLTLPTLANGIYFLCVIAYDGADNQTNASNTGFPFAVDANPILLTRHVSAVSTGHLFSCAIGPDGASYCWGENGAGQLGNGTMNDATSPGALSFCGTANCMKSNERFVSISTGLAHACGVTSEGIVHCWGSAADGALGNGTTVGNVMNPNKISAPNSTQTRFLEVSARGTSTVGLTVDGRVYRWGRNAYLNTAISTPVLISSLSQIVAVTAGGTHACALDTSGQAYCWGRNVNGELGDPIVGGQDAPLPVNQAGLRFVSIRAGDRFTCALADTGEAYCWGLNTKGQLGTGATNSDATFIHTPTQVSLGDREGSPEDYLFKELVVGGSHACGISGAGNIFCWGDNAFGQIGVGDSGGSYAQPRRINNSVLNQGEKWKRISATSNYLSSGSPGHTCGISDRGRLFCWGLNGHQQLGLGVPPVNGDVKTTPQETVLSTLPIPTQLLFSTVDVGLHHACAITTDGYTFCWGENTYGQLGTGSPVPPASAPSAVPVRVMQGLQPTGSRMISVVLGSDHTCGLAGNGEVYCWGRNENGELADTVTTIQNPAPSKVSDLSEQRTRAIGAGMSLGHTCAADPEGLLRCWGSNTVGQIGNGYTGGYELQPDSVADSSHRYRALALGTQASCGIRSNGETACWGTQMFASNVPTPIASGSNRFRSLNLGNRQACGVTATGLPICWGSGFQANPVTALPLPGVSSVVDQTFKQFLPGHDSDGTAGNEFQCGLSGAGNVLCIGYNTTGQLGNGSTSAVPTTSFTTVQMSGPERFVQIATAEEFSCGITDRGNLMCWGYDGQGPTGSYEQLGNGTSSSVATVPVPVTAPLN